MGPSGLISGLGAGLCRAFPGTGSHACQSLGFLRTGQLQEGGGGHVGGEEKVGDAIVTSKGKEKGRNARVVS